jgi:two-component system, cell cycle response regulator
VKKKPTLLIVEDNLDTQLFLKSAFESTNKYEVLLSGDGLDALEVVKLNQINGINNIKCILLDLHMPQMDGIEFLEALSKIEEDIPKIPVIITSAYEDAEKLEKAVEFDVAGYLLKPFEMDLVKKWVYRCVFAGATQQLRDMTRALCKKRWFEHKGEKPDLKFTSEEIRYFDELYPEIGFNQPFS